MYGHNANIGSEPIIRTNGDSVEKSVVYYSNRQSCLLQYYILCIAVMLIDVQPCVYMVVWLVNL